MSNVIEVDFSRRAEPAPVSSSYHTHYDRHGSPESPPRFYPRLGVYRASNVEFNPTTEIATSYGYWQFVARIGGRLVFNTYRFSVSTARHQRKVRRLLKNLGIAIDLCIEAPKGLQRLDVALEYHQGIVSRLKEEIARPRSNARKNEERREAIKVNTVKINSIKSIMRKAGA